MSFTVSEIKRMKEADRQIDEAFRLEMDDFRRSRELDKEIVAEGWTKKQRQNATYTRRWYAKNKQNVLDKKREYYRRNRERILAYRREYRENNRNEINAYNREVYRKRKSG